MLCLTKANGLVERSAPRPTTPTCGFTDQPSRKLREGRSESTVQVDSHGEGRPRPGRHPCYLRGIAGDAARALPRPGTPTRHSALPGNSLMRSLPTLPDADAERRETARREWGRVSSATRKPVANQSDDAISRLRLGWDGVEICWGMRSTEVRRMEQTNASATKRIETALWINTASSRHRLMPERCDSRSWASARRPVD